MVVVIKGRRTQMDRYDWLQYRDATLWIDSMGYVQVRSDGQRDRLHRLIIGARPGEITDHINRDKLDNRRSNLRIATRSGNGANSKNRSHNTTGYRGVSRDSWTGRYRATIRHNGRTVHGPRYDSAERAARWYDEHAKELHGVYAVLNFPDRKFVDPDNPGQRGPGCD